MKKVIVSLLVLALAATSVFAGVNFSGSFTTGYVFNYMTANDANQWKTWVFGDDNTDTNQTTLNLGFADDNGIWAVTLEGELMLDGAALAHPFNRVSGDISIDLAKLIMGDTDWTAQLQLLANDRITGLRAYTNKSGLNYDRVRTNEPGLWANAIVGYGDLLQVQIRIGLLQQLFSSRRLSASRQLPVSQTRLKSEQSQMRSLRKSPRPSLRISMQTTLSLQRKSLLVQPAQWV